MDERTDTNWGLVHTQLWTRTSTGRAVAELYVDNLSESLSPPSTTTYAYDAAGNLRAVTDATGVTTHTLYDKAGRVIGRVDGAGHLTEYVHDAEGRVVKTLRYTNPVDPTIHNLLLLADGTPNEVNFTLVRPDANAAEDRSTWNLYDDAGRLVYTIDEEGYASERFYDGAGRVTDIIQRATTVTTSALTAHSTAADVTVAADSLNDRHRRTFYDTAGARLADLDAEGYLTEYRYDAAGRQTDTLAHAAPLSAATPHASSALADIVADISADATAALKNIRTYTFYDGKGQVRGTVDGEGYLTEYVYDEAGNRTLELRYSQAVVVTAGATVNDLRPTPNANDRTTTNTYTALHQLETVRTPEGVVITHAYDAVGNRIRTTTELTAGTDTRTLTQRFDAQGRLIGELNGKGSAALEALINPSQLQIDSIWANTGLSHAYDGAGRRVSTTDANGHTTLFFYDQSSRLTHTVNALGEVTERVRDGFGQVTQRIEYATPIDSTGLAGGLVVGELLTRLSAARDTNKDRVTTTQYNLRGAIKEILNAENKQRLYNYNAFGEREGLFTQRGLGQDYLADDYLIQGYQYNKRGERTQINEGVLGTVLRTTTTDYDAFGRITQTTDGNSNVTSFDYDKRGQLITTIAADGTQTKQTYDAFGRTLTQTDARGKVTNFAYNATERSITVTTPEGHRHHDRHQRPRSDPVHHRWRRVYHQLRI